MSLCRLSDKQYDAIINMRIRSLAKLQEQNIKKELEELTSQEKGLLQIIKSPTRLKTYLKKRFEKY